MPKTVELEMTEAKLLAVALREYLQDGNGRGGGGRASDAYLRDHATSRSIIEDIIERIDGGPEEGPTGWMEKART